MSSTKPSASVREEHNWFDGFPKHWRESSLKNIVDPNRSITYGIVQAGPNIENGIPYIRPADMTDENGIADPVEILRTSQEIASSYRRSEIASGDLVCSIGPSFGKVMVTPDWLNGANLTQGTARIAVNAANCSRYYFWVLRSLASIAQWESSVGGATFRALNLRPLAATRILIPPLEDQQAIADFLDRETAKIDALVAEQRRLIELLSEKRQAVISHAVTKGLDPNVKMKPSGIEWLGDVPEHWEVTKLSRYASIENGSTPSRNNPRYWDDGTIPWISSGAVNQYHVENATEWITRQALDECPLRLLPIGTLIVGMIGQGKTRGLAAILKIEAAINQNLAAISTNNQLNVEFLHYVFQAAYVYLREFGRGGQQAALNCEILGSTTIPIPPVEEQRDIAKDLDRVMGEFERLSANLDQMVSLLLERRTALISAAVTGKIDVREFACQET